MRATRLISKYAPIQKRIQKNLLNYESQLWRFTSYPGPTYCSKEDATTTIKLNLCNTTYVETVVVTELYCHWQRVSGS
jgi:hypothetical protein